MIYWYFGALVVLAALSQVPDFLFLASVLIVPGFMLAAANTLLLYSLLLLPFFIWPRGLLKRPALALIALVPATTVAFGLPALSQARRDAFVAQQTRENFDRATSLQNIRSLTIVAARSSEIFCNDLCERLLYNRDVEKIVKAYWGGTRFEGAPHAIAYRVEHQPACRITPTSPGAHSMGAKARMDSGDCIIPESNADPEAADATIGQWPIYQSLPSWKDPRGAIDRILFELEGIEEVNLIAGGPRTGQPVLHQTLISARALATPFRLWISGNEFSPRMAVVRTEADYPGYAMEAVLREKLGFRLEPVANPQ
jgi:hypothetical protein